MRQIFIIFFLGSLACIGCNNGPGRVAAPKLDAEEITDRVMQEFDKNLDSVVDSDELEEAPSLRYSLKALDKNENGDLERAEILERFNLYVQLKIGLSRKFIQFTKRGKPLTDAEVLLEPAPFMEGLIEPARGKTGPQGYALMLAENQSLGARTGFYRVKITSAKDKVDAKYNENTELGFEIAPITDGLGTESIIDIK